jgi:predicted small secreted protein
MNFINFLKEKGWLSYVIGFGVGVALSILVMPSISILNSSKEEYSKQLREEYEQRLSVQQSEFKSRVEQYEKDYEEAKSEAVKKEQEYERKVASLMSEISTLNSMTETEELEIHYPDGRWERRKVSKSTVQQLSQKIAEVKDELSSKHKEEMTAQEQKHSKEVADIRETLSQQIARREQTISSKDEEIKKLKESSTTTVVNQRKFGVGGGINSDGLYKVHVDYMVWGPVYIGADVDTNRKDTHRVAISAGIRF